MSAMNISCINLSADALKVNGTVTAQTFNSLSDYKLKENIVYLNKEFNPILFSNKIHKILSIFICRVVYQKQGNRKMHYYNKINF